MANVFEFVNTITAFPFSTSKIWEAHNLPEPPELPGSTGPNLSSSLFAVEFLFLLWGIRLCIMVRKAPSEFNESRFISMTIYNEFLLSIFLNVSV